MPHCRSKCSKPRAAIEGFYWNVWNILTSVLSSIRVRTMEINSSIFYNSIDSFWSSITLNFLRKSHARENLRKHSTISSFPFSVLHQLARQNHSVNVTVKKFFRAISFFLQRRQDTQYVHELHWAIRILLLWHLYLFFNYLFRTNGFRRLKIHDKGSGSPVCFVEYQVHSLPAFFLLHRHQPLS